MEDRKRQEVEVEVEVEKKPLSVAQVLENASDHKDAIRIGQATAIKNAKNENKKGRVLNDYPPLVDEKIYKELMEKATTISERLSGISFSDLTNLTEEEKELAEADSGLQFGFYIKGINPKTFEGIPAAKAMMEIYDQVIRIACSDLLSDAKTIKPEVAKAFFGEEREIKKISVTAQQLVSSFAENVIGNITVSFQKKNNEETNKRMRAKLGSAEVNLYEDLYERTPSDLRKYLPDIDAKFVQAYEQKKRNENEIKQLGAGQVRLYETMLQTMRPEDCKNLISLNDGHAGFIQTYNQFIDERNTKNMRWTALTTRAQKVWTESAEEFGKYISKKMNEFPYEKVNALKMLKSQLVAAKKDLPDGVDSDSIDLAIKNIDEFITNKKYEFNLVPLMKDLSNPHIARLELSLGSLMDLLTPAEKKKVENEVVNSIVDELEKMKSIMGKFVLPTTSASSSAISTAVASGEKLGLLNNAISIVDKTKDLNQLIIQLSELREKTSNFLTLDEHLEDYIAKLKLLRSMKEEKKEEKKEEPRKKINPEVRKRLEDIKKTLSTILEGTEKQISSSGDPIGDKAKLGVRNSLLEDTLSKIEEFLSGEKDIVSLLLDFESLRGILDRDIGLDPLGIIKKAQLAYKLFDIANQMQDLITLLTPDERGEFIVKIAQEKEARIAIEKRSAGEEGKHEQGKKEKKTEQEVPPPAASASRPGGKDK